LTIRPIEIRLIGLPDVEAILSIQAVSPEIAQWTPGDYGRVARGEMAGWVAEEMEGIEGFLAGFLIGRQVLKDLEILNFAVRPDRRREGLGRKLLEKALEWGRSFEAENALLEVRASNLAALNFYEQQGFVAVGRRKGYYRAPVDDALVLSRRLV
jgi:[ribosomal protein S18]-alanine N-acetyltransferase